MQPLSLLAARLLGGGVTIAGEESQQQIGYHLAYVKGDGAIAGKLSIDHPGGGVRDHQAARVQIPVQQRLLLLAELCLRHPPHRR